MKKEVVLDGLVQSRALPRAGVLILCLGSGVVSGLAAAQSGQLTAALLAAVLFFLVFTIAVADVRLELWILLLCAYFLEYAAYLVHLPPQLTWLVYPLLVAPAMAAIPRLRVLPAVAWIVVTLVALGAMTAALVAGANDLAVFSAIWAFWTDYAFVLLFLVVAVTSPSGSQWRRLSGLPILVGLFQIPAVLAQKVAYWGKSPDFTGGTLGPHSTGPNSVFIPMVLALMLALYITTGRRLFLVGLPFLLIPLVTGSARAGFLIALVSALAVLAVRGVVTTNRRARIVVPTAAVVLCVVAALFAIRTALPALDSRDARAWSLTTSYSAAYRYGLQRTKTGSFGRIGALQFAQHRISASPATLILGFGPGASRVFMGDSQGPLLKANPEIESGMTSWARALLDYGWLGLILQVTLTGLAISTGIRLYRRETSPWWAGIGLGLPGLAVAYFLGGALMLSWGNEPLAATFWFTFGLTAGRLVLVTSRPSRRQGETASHDGIATTDTRHAGQIKASHP